VKGNQVKPIRMSHNSHTHIGIPITIRLQPGMAMCLTPHYKLQVINGPPTIYLLKAFIQSCVKIFQRHPSLHAASPGATPASLGEISADRLAGTTCR